MTNASSTPGTAAKIDDLFGSAVAVATVIHVAWPNRFHRRKPAFPLRPRNVLKGDGSGQVRDLLRPQAAGPMDSVSASGIGPWHWKAIFRATWPSRTKNSMPSPAFAARPWMSFWRAPDRLDPGADSTLSRSIAG
jgi:hypothetical protein